MKYLSVSLKRFSFLLLLLFSLVMTATVSAVNNSSDHEILMSDDNPDEIKIKIKIIIIIRKKNPKVAEVTGFLLPNATDKLKENRLWAEAEIVGDNLNIRMADPDIEGFMILFPKGIRVPQEVASELGRKNAFTIAGGKLKMDGDKLGNFEIQD